MNKIGKIITIGLLIAGAIASIMISRKVVKQTNEMLSEDKEMNESIDRITESIVNQVGIEGLDQCKDEIIKSYIKSIAARNSRILRCEEQEIIKCEITKSIDRIKKRYRAI